MATTKYNAVMVDKIIQAAAVANGFTRQIDVSSFDDEWSLKNCKPCGNRFFALSMLGIDVPTTTVLVLLQ